MRNEELRETLTRFGLKIITYNRIAHDFINGYERFEMSFFRNDTNRVRASPAINSSFLTPHS